MCGIVCFWGRFDGLLHVIEALRLLEYRAPDSTGIASPGESGQFRVIRSVGPTKNLLQTMQIEPLFRRIQPTMDGISRLLEKQRLPIAPDALRNGTTIPIEYLYRQNGFAVGVGDYAGVEGVESATVRSRISSDLDRILRNSPEDLYADFGSDPVRHAFRLVAIHIGSRVDIDENLRMHLDQALFRRVPPGRYKTWTQAWAEEVEQLTPAMAFATGVRYFQTNFPGLANFLGPDDWERVGGLTAQAMSQVMIGHGRWAAVGEVTRANSHPFLDRSGTRVVCENGSHNAKLMLQIRDEQAHWWQGQGLDTSAVLHRSQNTTEVIAFEWERYFHRLKVGDLEAYEHAFINRLEVRSISNPDEQALRLTLHKIRSGNAHACVFYSRYSPGKLYVSSHDKPIAIALRSGIDDGGMVQQEIMVASDVNAALMLWPGPKVDEAAQIIQRFEMSAQSKGIVLGDTDQTIQAVLGQFVVEVIFLDADLHEGKELLACISNRIDGGQVVREIRVTRYDGSPVEVNSHQVHLSPAMLGKGGYPSFTESHIAEIPNVMTTIIETYVEDQQVKMDSLWQDGNLFQPGLETRKILQRFGSQLGRLKRIVLIGEGSSWRDARAAAPLFRALLPSVLVDVYRPVEMLNLGEVIHREHDLVVEISWSGTTDSLLKVDYWLNEMGVLRLGITGRPQSDLGRRTQTSAGTINVFSGVEVSVATVKGFHSILVVLNLLALQFAHFCGEAANQALQSRLLNELSNLIPRLVRKVVENPVRRDKIHKIARHCAGFNKIAVIGHSPIELEGELKIEELAQIVACTFDFSDTSLRSLIARMAVLREEWCKVLIVINASTPQAFHKAQPLLAYLREMEVFSIIHTFSHPQVNTIEKLPFFEIVLSPSVTELLQPLVDALFFFDLSVALAYARGLSPEEIDNPRNLAKSITITSAERRSEVERRETLINISLEEFTSGRSAEPVWDPTLGGRSTSPARVSTLFQKARSSVRGPLPPGVNWKVQSKLILVTETDSAANGVRIANVVWKNILGMELVSARRSVCKDIAPHSQVHIMNLTQVESSTGFLSANTIGIPVKLLPYEEELVTAIILTRLGLRIAKFVGVDAMKWQIGLERMEGVVTGILSDQGLSDTFHLTLEPYVRDMYDKFQIIGGGQDFLSAISIARSLRCKGFMAEELYTDSAWHGPLATVGGPDAEHDTLILILATDPLFQPTALVDTQVYRVRHASVLFVVPEGNKNLPVVTGVDATAVIEVPAVPRPFVPLANAALGQVLADSFARLWETQDEYS